METPLEAINRQIKQEKDRHSRIINDLDSRKSQENIKYQQTMNFLNNRKDMVKRTIESFFKDLLHKKYTTLDRMCELIEKATEDFDD